MARRDVSRKGGPGDLGKAHLPSKPCVACGRPFAWRKKWATCWDEVKYCSNRCRSGGRGKQAGG